MPYLFQTPRLALRQLTFDDTAFLIELLNSPGWLQYIGDRNVRNHEQAVIFLENGPMKSYAKYGHGLWLVEKKDDGAPIGLCGILRREGLDIPDIGFSLLPQYGGQGYAFEMATATVRYANETLKIPSICGIVMPSNAPSRQLLEKLGLELAGPIILPNITDELLLYR